MGLGGKVGRKAPRRAVLLRLDLNKEILWLFLVLYSRCVDNVADIYYNGGITNNELFRKNKMHVEIFFETADQAAAFNDFPVKCVDGDRVVIYVDWHPSHLRGLTTELMDMVGVVDCDTCDFF